MDFGIITPAGQVMVSKPFTAIAVDAASRIYPVRDGIIAKDIDRHKREQLEKAIASALLQIALEVHRM
jgi:hypothetical protein